MARTVGLVVAVGAALIGCGPDDSGGGTKDAGNGSGDGGGSGSGCGIGTGVLLSGTTCDGPVSFTLGGDECIFVAQTVATGLIQYIAVLDGPFFIPETEPAWQSYALTSDVALFLNFDTEQPATPHTVTALRDSVFGGRNAGTFGFEETSMSATVTINAIDMTARTIDVSFSAGIFGSTPAYPPDFASVTECPGTGAAVTGSFSGGFTLMPY